MVGFWKRHWEMWKMTWVVQLVWLTLYLTAFLVIAPRVIGAELTPVEKRAEELTHWIVERTEYQYVPPPAILFVPHLKLNYVFFSASKGGYKGQDSVQGMYVPRLMLLRDDFILGKDDDFLLHELVHHLQYMHDKLVYGPKACYAKLELEAYDLQARFVTETGVGRVPSAFYLIFLAEAAATNCASME